MKSIVSIKFKKINNVKVNKTLLLANPKLIEVSKKTMTILCQQIKKYFDDHLIKIRINFILEEND